jgi:hypothetical protein
MSTITTPEWVTTENATNLLGVSRSTLHELKRGLALHPGEHWIYSAGTTRGRILWCIPAIRRWQIDRTNDIYSRQSELPGELPETYIGLPVEEKANG